MKILWEAKVETYTTLLQFSLGTIEGAGYSLEFGSALLIEKFIFEAILTPYYQHISEQHFFKKF